MIAQRDILSEIMDEITIRRMIYGIRERILSKPDEAHSQSLLHGHKNTHCAWVFQFTERAEHECSHRTFPKAIDLLTTIFIVC